MVGAFEQAWSLLKALPEQQMYEQMSRPAPYGFNPDIHQQRLGSAHPAIVGMLNRLENPHEYKLPTGPNNPRTMRSDLFSNVPMTPNLRVMSAGEQSTMPLPESIGIDLPYPANMIPMNPTNPVMMVGRTPLSIENYGKHFEENRAAGGEGPSFMMGDSGDLHTEHFNIPQAGGGTITNASPLMPIDSDGRGYPRQVSHTPFVPEPKGVPDNFDPMALDQTTLDNLSRRLNRQ